MIIGLDPGNTQSAWVLLENGAPVDHGKALNDDVLAAVRSGFDPQHLLAVEMIASYGMAVGREVFETCLWIGRFVEAWNARGGRHQLVYRMDVKRFHCNTTRANDSNIRAALIDRYGPGRDVAVGTKRSQGPLYGIKADEWSALAVALTAEGEPAPAPLFRAPVAPVRELSEQPF